MKKPICFSLLAIILHCTCQAQNRAVISFSAVVRGTPRAVQLSWDVDSAEDGDYFIIERGQDSLHFETIGAVRSVGRKGHYELTDQAAPNGSDFYRVKCAGPGDSAVYSRTMELALSGEVDFKFYPNPVDKVFIVRTEHVIDLQVFDPAGNSRISKRLQPGLQVVSAASLEPGVYILRVTDKESNRSVTQQLVKN